MQRSWTSLPHLGHVTLLKSRTYVAFLGDRQQTPIYHGGSEWPPDEMLVIPSGSEHYHRASTELLWGSMSLTPEDLAAAGRALVGHDLASPAVAHRFRPAPHWMARLRHWHAAAGHMAAAFPDILAHAEVARAMEDELVRAMVACLTDGGAEGQRARGHHRQLVMRRLERVLEANQDKPLYLTELCAAVGASGRALRMYCQEHLGMSPHRYLLLRRMNLARRALALADPTATTVAAIANDHGFGELGRFAVSYRKLFGETPSTTLRRAPDPPADHSGAGNPMGNLPILP
ncbi:MAG: AraC family transcriptional regulator [Caulobacteraceae bacterium]|nr:AraC family transcriptional regulator [Caulobacteraceae bacterium]